MKRIAFVALLALAGPAAAQDSKQAPTVVAEPARVGIGKTFPDLASARQGARALVVAFRGPDCPLSKLYEPKFERLAKEYGAKEVRFLVVSTEDAAYGRVLEPARTTEAFLLDGSNVLRYRGAIDDQYGIGYQRDAATRTYLTDAIEAVLAGREPPVAATEAPGCAVARAPAPAAPTGVTFHKDVEPIFQRRCVDCHRPGEMGPFSLLKYEKAKSNAEQIKLVVTERRMPPWHADPSVGEWANERRLSDLEIATIASWVDAGAPRGDPADAPKPREFVDGWQIGTPDAVFQIPTPQRIKAEGTIPYAYVTVPTGLKEDTWVQAMEVRPTARAAVHHVLVFVKYPEDRKAEEGVFDGGLVNGYFGALVPGGGGIVFPEGCAKKLPAGGRLVFQIHYTATGKPLEDQSMIGLVYAKKPVTREVITRGIVNTNIRIPPGAPNHEETATTRFRENVKLLSFLPHTHVRGKSFKYVAIHPDGRTETLLDVPAYDFDWQTSYRLKEPLSIKKGTRLKVYVRYDNSANNPANPDPTKEVRFGQQTWQEMLIGYVDYIEE